MLLQERTASATLEDDEEELEDDEVDADDRGDGPTRSCRAAPTSSSASRASSCCRSDALADGAAALRRLRLTA